MCPPASAFLFRLVFKIWTRIDGEQLKRARAGGRGEVSPQPLPRPQLPEQRRSLRERGGREPLAPLKGLACAPSPQRCWTSLGRRLCAFPPCTFISATWEAKPPLALASPL